MLPPHLRVYDFIRLFVRPSSGSTPIRAKTLYVARFQCALCSRGTSACSTSTPPYRLLKGRGVPCVCVCACVCCMIPRGVDFVFFICHFSLSFSARLLPPPHLDLRMFRPSNVQQYLFFLRSSPFPGSGHHVRLGLRPVLDNPPGLRFSPLLSPPPTSTSTLHTHVLVCSVVGSGIPVCSPMGQDGRVVGPRGVSRQD